MAEIDVFVRDKLWTFAIPFIGLAFFLILFMTDSLKDVRRKLFAKYAVEASKLYNEMTTDVKRELFRDLNDIISNVVDLKNRGLVRIMEIGVGSGSNLKYYPQQSRLIVVDPNIYFRQFFMENLNKFPDIHLENYIISGGENIRGVKSNSVDIVVTTIVLCSVDDIQAVLKEIRRILVPGGRYYYLEHVLDTPTTRRYTVHRLFSKTRLWPLIFDGCDFKDIDNEIAKAGFSSVEQKRFHINTSNSRLLKVVSPHVVGIATK